MEFKDPLSQEAENTKADDNTPYEDGIRAEDRMMAFAAYVPLGFLIPMILEKKSEFVQFHIRQGVILFTLWIILFMLPIIGGLATFGYIIAVMYCGAKAYGGEKYELPVVGEVKKFLGGLFNKE